MEVFPMCVATWRERERERREGSKGGRERGESLEKDRMEVFPIVAVES